VDGDSHYSENGIEYDIKRTKILNDNGVEVIRFTNSEVGSNIEGVIEMIKQKITTPTYSL